MLRVVLEDTKKVVLEEKVVQKVLEHIQNYRFLFLSQKEEKNHLKVNHLMLSIEHQNYTLEENKKDLIVVILFLLMTFKIILFVMFQMQIEKM